MLLNCQTYFSLKFGTWKPADLLCKAVEFGYTSICITDINNTSAVIDSLRIAPEIGIKVIPGIDFRNGAEQLFVGIAKNNRGFAAMNSYLSHHLHAQIPIPPTAPAWEDVFVIYPFGAAISHQLPIAIGTVVRGGEIKLKADSRQLTAFFGLPPHQIPQLRLSPLRHRMDKLVMMPTVSFAGKGDFNAHRLLRAMDLNTLLSKLPKSEEGDPRDVLVPKAELLKYYEEFPEIIKNTERLIEACEVTFDYHQNKNKQRFTASHEEDMHLLRAECEKGIRYRFPQAEPKVMQRVEHELRIIEQMGFSSYFLINWDIINYARSQGYFHVGRGSGANSLVAYLLQITDVDPIELDLYFERFINPHRTTPPDFDIDFSWADRNDITKYIFDKHGWDHVALQGTYSTFKEKAISRELGKVFGVPDEEIDHFQKTGRNHNLGQYGNLILKYGAYIQDFPSHLSIHSCGILISEQPIHSYSATFMPPKGFPTTQFSMIEAEDVGLYKFDILSQRGLGKIRDSVDIIRHNRGEDVDVHDIPRFKNDERIRNLLREGRAIGCFYVESPAMRMLLTKLKAETYIALVAASSIIRPGVSRSGMMREYIQRFQEPPRREEARLQCPELYAILEETYGVMVYQEDVIRVAHFFAGLTLAEADILRRGMSWKFKERSEFHRVKERFFLNCREKGYAEALIDKVWFEIETFANFAFAKGHSASYAVESYQTLFLKAYYPIEYMVATVNNGGGFYRPEVYLHEARMHGASIEAPCVNSSEVITLVHGTIIVLGFHMIKDLEQRTMERLQRAREEALFESLADFVDRVPVGVEQLEILIKAGAFRFTGKTKKELNWEVRLLMGKAKKKDTQPKLFAARPKAFQFPDLYSAPLEDAFDQIELLGFPLCDPFLLAKHSMKGGVLAADLPEYLGKTVVSYGYLVTARKTHTAKGEGMYFGNFLDRKGFFLDSVHFPPVAKAFPFSGRGIYRIVGKVTEDFGCYQIEATEMHRVPYIEDPRYSEEEKYKGTKDHGMGMSKLSKSGKSHEL